VPPSVQEAVRTPGDPLDSATRALMESRFGHDFSQVRVHTDRRAGEAAEAIDAAAYTAGRHVVFVPERYRPGTIDGRRLLAHELAHVVQQGGNGLSQAASLSAPGDQHEREASRAAAAVVDGGIVRVQALPHAAGRIDRDLATPRPRERPHAQPDLTDDGIRAAIEFNSARYDEANTKRIQDLVGTRPTGTWDAATIRLVARLQEEFGLTKNGKVDHETFRFLQREQQLEGAPTTAERCLAAFGVTVSPVQQSIVAAPGGGSTLRLVGHHQVEAEFSDRCGCSKYQYRQLIEGTAVGSRGTQTQDLAGLFPFIPGGRLPATFQEDGNTNWASPNYGHREQAGQDTTDATNAENHYVNDQNVTDQARGCRYRGEDFPKVTVQGLRSGDLVTMQVRFRGVIERDGTPVQTKEWTDLNENVTIP
jgi:uncharacterized protein DUF4157